MYVCIGYLTSQSMIFHLYLMCRRTEEILPTVRLPQRHFVGFYSVPVQALTRGHPFYNDSEKQPHFSHLLRGTWGYGERILILNPRVPTGYNL